ncbi:MAG: hypothetical protein AMXMBFR64_45560 [Myxococcales bacterium]
MRVVVQETFPGELSGLSPESLRRRLDLGLAEARGLVMAKAGGAHTGERMEALDELTALLTRGYERRLKQLREDVLRVAGSARTS